MPGAREARGSPSDSGLGGEKLVPIMRIAIVNQPWSRVPPAAADSIGILTNQIAGHLAGSGCNVVCYGRRFGREPDAERLKNGVQVRRVSAWLDQWLRPLRLIDRIGLCNPRRPFVTSPFYQIGYIWQVGRDLREGGCDVVHLHNFPHCAGLLRWMNRHVPIVLH